MTKKVLKPIGLHGTNAGTMAQKGHLSENKPFEFKRAKDEPGRIEELMRKRQNVGSYARVNKKTRPVPPAPIVLDWKPPKAR